MKPKFKNAVDAGDLISTRLFLANEMMLDPRGNSFMEMRSYAESSFSNLYEPHDGSVFNQDTDNWCEDLLFSTKNDLDSNFSRERLDYYFKLAKFVLKEKAENLDIEDLKAAQRKANSEFTEKEQEHHHNSKRTVYTGMTVGGAALILAGMFIKKSAVAYTISSLGIIGMAVGGYLLYNEKKK